MNSVIDLIISQDLCIKETQLFLQKYYAQKYHKLIDRINKKQLTLKYS